MCSDGNLLLTVITVCKNDPEGLEATLKTLLEQDEAGYELIIQDGGSSDGTLITAERYRALFRERGIEVRIFSGEDGGVYHAMNKAVAKAAGDYIIFMNAGDSFAHGGVVRKLRQAVLSESADVFYGDALMTDGSDTVIFKGDMSIRGRMPFCHQAAFFKRAVLLQNPFEYQYRICADLDLVLKLMEKNCSFAGLDTLVCRYRMDGVSSRRYIKKRLEHERILRRHNIAGPFSFIVHMSEAVIKTVAGRLAPQALLGPMKHFYAGRVKQYLNWNGEIY